MIDAFIQLFEENIQRNLDAVPVVRQKDNSKITQRTRPFSSVIDSSESEFDLNKENSLKHVQVCAITNLTSLNLIKTTSDNFH